MTKRGKAQKIPKQLYKELRRLRGGSYLEDKQESLPIEGQSAYIGYDEILQDAIDCDYLALANGNIAVLCQKLGDDGLNKMYFGIYGQDNQRLANYFYSSTGSLFNPVLKLMDNGSSIGIFYSIVRSNQIGNALRKIDLATGTEKSATGLFTVIHSDQNPNPKFMVENLANGGFVVAFPNGLGNIEFREYTSTLTLASTAFGTKIPFSDQLQLVATGANRPDHQHEVFFFYQESQNQPIMQGFLGRELPSGNFPLVLGPVKTVVNSQYINSFQITSSKTRLPDLNPSADLDLIHLTYEESGIVKLQPINPNGVLRGSVVEVTHPDSPDYKLEYTISIDASQDCTLAVITDSGISYGQLICSDKSGNSIVYGAQFEIPADITRIIAGPNIDQNHVNLLLIGENQGQIARAILNIDNVASPSATQTPTPSFGASRSPSRTPTASQLASISPTPIPSPDETPTPSPSPDKTPTPTPSPDETPTPSPDETPTPSITITRTASISATRTSSASKTLLPSPTESIVPPSISPFPIPVSETTSPTISQLPPLPSINPSSTPTTSSNPNPAPATFSNLVIFGISGGGLVLALFLLLALRHFYNKARNVNAHRRLLEGDEQGQELMEIVNYEEYDYRDETEFTFDTNTEAPTTKRRIKLSPEKVTLLGSGRRPSMDDMIIVLRHSITLLNCINADKSLVDQSIIEIETYRELVKGNFINSDRGNISHSSYQILKQNSKFFKNLFIIFEDIKDVIDDNRINNETTYGNSYKKLLDKRVDRLEREINLHITAVILQILKEQEVNLLKHPLIIKSSNFIDGNRDEFFAISDFRINKKRGEIRFSYAGWNGSDSGKISRENKIRQILVKDNIIYEILPSVKRKMSCAEVTQLFGILVDNKDKSFEVIKIQKPMDNVKHLQDQDRDYVALVRDLSNVMVASIIPESDALTFTVAQEFTIDDQTTISGLEFERKNDNRLQSLTLTVKRHGRESLKVNLDCINGSITPPEFSTKILSKYFAIISGQIIVQAGYPAIVKYHNAQMLSSALKKAGILMHDDTGYDLYSEEYDKLYKVQTGFIDSLSLWQYLNLDGPIHKRFTDLQKDTIETVSKFMRDESTTHKSQEDVENELSDKNRLVIQRVQNLELEQDEVAIIAAIKTAMEGLEEMYDLRRKVYRTPLKQGEFNIMIRDARDQANIDPHPLHQDSIEAFKIFILGMVLTTLDVIKFYELPEDKANIELLKKALYSLVGEVVVCDQINSDNIKQLKIAFDQIIGQNKLRAKVGDGRYQAMQDLDLTADWRTNYDRQTEVTKLVSELLDSIIKAFAYSADKTTIGQISQINALQYTDKQKQQKIDEILKQRLGELKKDVFDKAKDDQMMRFDGYICVTIFKLELLSIKKVFVEIDIPLIGLTNVQESDWKKVRDYEKKDEQEDDQELPVWFAQLPEWRKQILKDLAPIVLQAKKAHPTQWKDGQPGLRNAFCKFTCEYDSINNRLIIQDRKLHLGTIASFGEDKLENQATADQNTLQLQAISGGKKARVVINSLNSPNNLFDSKDTAIFIQSKRASEFIDGIYTNTAFNLWRIFSTNLKGIKKDKGSSVYYDQISDFLSDIQSAIETISDVDLNALWFIKNEQKYHEALNALSNLESQGLIGEAAHGIIKRFLELGRIISLSKKEWLSNPGQWWLDPENTNLKIVIELSALIKAINQVKKIASNNTAESLELLKGLDLRNLAQMSKSVDEVIHAILCASGKDRTQLALIMRDADLLSNLYLKDLVDLARQSGTSFSEDELLELKEYLSQRTLLALLVAGHAQNQNGTVYGGCFFATFGTKIENFGGTPESRKILLAFFISKLADFNKLNEIFQPTLQDKFSFKALGNTIKDAAMNKLLLRLPKVGERFELFDISQELKTKIEAISGSKARVDSDLDPELELEIIVRSHSRKDLNKIAISILKDLKALAENLPDEVNSRSISKRINDLKKLIKKLSSKEQEPFKDLLKTFAKIKITSESLANNLEALDAHYMAFMTIFISEFLIAQSQSSIVIKQIRPTTSSPDSEFQAIDNIAINGTNIEFLYIKLDRRLDQESHYQHEQRKLVICDKKIFISSEDSKVAMDLLEIQELYDIANDFSSRKVKPAKIISFENSTLHDDLRSFLDCEISDSSIYELIIITCMVSNDQKRTFEFDEKKVSNISFISDQNGGYKLTFDIENLRTKKSESVEVGIDEDKTVTIKDDKLTKEHLIEYLIAINMQAIRDNHSIFGYYIAQLLSQFLNYDDATTYEVPTGYIDRSSLQEYLALACSKQSTFCSFVPELTLEEQRADEIAAIDELIKGDAVVKGLAKSDNKYSKILSGKTIDILPSESQDGEYVVKKIEGDEEINYCTGADNDSVTLDDLRQLREELEVIKKFYSCDKSLALLAQEFVRTETNYKAKLEMLEAVLLSHCKENNTTSATIVHCVAHLTKLIKMSQEVLDVIKDPFSNYEIHNIMECYGKAIRDYLDFYSTNQSNEALTKLSLPEISPNTFRDIFITPVQRIMRYDTIYNSAIDFIKMDLDDKRYLSSSIEYLKTTKSSCKDIRVSIVGFVGLASAAAKGYTEGKILSVFKYIKDSSDVAGLQTAVSSLIKHLNSKKMIMDFLESIDEPEKIDSNNAHEFVGNLLILSTLNTELKTRSEDEQISELVTKKYLFLIKIVNNYVIDIFKPIELAITNQEEVSEVCKTYLVNLNNWFSLCGIDKNPEIKFLYSRNWIHVEQLDIYSRVNRFIANAQRLILKSDTTEDKEIVETIKQSINESLYKTQALDQLIGLTKKDFEYNFESDKGTIALILLAARVVDRANKKGNPLYYKLNTVIGCMTGKSREEEVKEKITNLFNKIINYVDSWKDKQSNMSESEKLFGHLYIIKSIIGFANKAFDRASNPLFEDFFSNMDERLRKSKANLEISDEPQSLSSSIFELFRDKRPASRNLAMSYMPGIERDRSVTRDRHQDMTRSELLPSPSTFVRSRIPAHLDDASHDLQ